MVDMLLELYITSMHTLISSRDTHKKEDLKKLYREKSYGQFPVPYQNVAVAFVLTHVVVGPHLFIGQKAVEVKNDVYPVQRLCRKKIQKEK